MCTEVDGVVAVVDAVLDGKANALTIITRGLSRVQQQ